MLRVKGCSFCRGLTAMAAHPPFRRCEHSRPSWRLLLLGQHFSVGLGQLNDFSSNFFQLCRPIIRGDPPRVVGDDTCRFNGAAALGAEEMIEICEASRLHLCRDSLAED